MTAMDAVAAARMDASLISLDMSGREVTVISIGSPGAFYASVEQYDGG